MNLSNKLIALTLAGLCLGTLPALQSCNSNRPATVGMEDSEVTTKIKAKYAADSDVSFTDISVNTEEGVVYLTGRVATQEEKNEAERIAEKIDGVKDVVNHLKVGQMPAK